MPYIDQDGILHKKEFTNKKSKKKVMDFSKIKRTRIALKFSYIGKNYAGGLVL